MKHKVDCSLNVYKSRLVLQGNCIGYRYSIRMKIPNRPLGAFDVPVGLKASFELGLINRFSEVIAKNSADMKCKVEGDSIVSYDERGVKGISEERELILAFRRMEAECKAVLRFHHDFSNYAGEFRAMLSDAGLIGYGLGIEDSVDPVEMIYRVRFIGGESAWSCSLGDDICDADILDRDTAARINRVVDIFKLRFDGVSISWYASEKAWVHFSFNAVGGTK